MIEIEGLKLEESDFVYKPAEDSFLAINAIKKALGKKTGMEILDMGTGTGILGLYAAKLCNAKRLILADISKSACKLAKKNYEANKDKIGSTKVAVVKSNLFDKIDGKFDLIIFNAPYLPGVDFFGLGRAWSGGRRGIEISVKFLKEVEGHLKRGGRIILIASSLSDFEGLKKEIEELGYAVEEMLKEHYFFEDIMALILARARVKE
ncbi:MAG: HemK2/MTQ2 family protein methyltransferase [Candidatus Micrarchaeia archaeon]